MEAAIAPTAPTHVEFTTGDRVFVTNRVRKPTLWNPRKEWTAEKERHATVTKVNGYRIQIRTDNGVETWRAEKNLNKQD